MESLYDADGKTPPADGVPRRLAVSVGGSHLKGMEQHPTLPLAEEWLPTLAKLVQVMGMERVKLLSDQLFKMAETPGYGEITIRVHDHRFAVMKVTSDFK